MDNNGQWKGWIQLLLGLGLTVLFFYMMAPFLVAILLAAVTTIVVYPVFVSLAKRMPRALSALIVTGGIAVGILGPIIFMLYSGSYRLLQVFGQLKLPKDGSVDNLLYHPTVTRILETLSRFTPVDHEWLRAQSIDILQNIIEKVTHLIAGFIGGMPALLMAFVIVILSVYFFLVDGARFLRFLSSVSPLKDNRSQELYGSFEKSCRGVVIGLFASSAVQALLMSIFFSITGLPDPLFTAGLTFVMGMVPVVGSAPIWIGAVLYLFLKGSTAMAIVMLVGGILVSTSDNIVRPVIMKGQAEMHPLLALVSVFGAVNLLGATGIFLGPIIAAVFVSFLKILALEIRRENMGLVAPGGPVETPPPITPAK